MPLDTRRNLVNDWVLESGKQDPLYAMASARSGMLASVGLKGCSMQKGLRQADVFLLYRPSLDLLWRHSQQSSRIGMLEDSPTATWRLTVPLLQRAFPKRYCLPARRLVLILSYFILAAHMADSVLESCFTHL